MADFVAFFPQCERSAAPTGEFEAIKSLYSEVFHARQVNIRKLDATLLLTADHSGSDGLLFHADPRGWIAAKGLIFDVRAEQPAANPGRLLDEFVENDVPDWSRYEGSFAIAAWDARRERAVLVNDQAGVLAEYYGRFGDGLYVTTRPVFLARALRLALDPEGVRQFLARGQVLGPGTVFAGLKRLGVGEYAVFQCGRLELKHNWIPYFPPKKVKMAEAAAELARVATDRVRRYAAVRQPIVSDLTGGYDTRLLVCAMEFAKVDYAVTVNGGDTDADVMIAAKVASAIGRPVRHFDFNRLPATPLNDPLRRELLYRTNGQLAFTAPFFHVSSRPQLAQDYRVHFSGAYGDFARSFPWQHELWGIGRRQQANLDRTMRYRFLQTGKPPADLFCVDWYPLFTQRLRSQLEEICNQVPNQLTTQQLDAVLLWKMGSHFTAWGSALFDWLPAVWPLASAGFLETALATPWRFKLGCRLNRLVNFLLSPQAAAVVTQYGGTGAPVSCRTLHREMLQIIRDSTHLAEKLDRVVLKGFINRRLRIPLRLKITTTPFRVPFVTSEFRAIMDPDHMLSRRIYRHKYLTNLMRSPDEVLYNQQSLVTVLGTIELLCRETGFEPSSDFLAGTL
jgi:hypothetical protein